MLAFCGCNDAKHADIHHNDTQRNNKNATFSIITFHATAECRHADYHLSVTIKSLVVSVVMPNVVILNDVAPFYGHKAES